MPRNVIALGLALGVLTVSALSYIRNEVSFSARAPLDLSLVERALLNSATSSQEVSETREAVSSSTAPVKTAPRPAIADQAPSGASKKNQKAGVPVPSAVNPAGTAMPPPLPASTSTRASLTSTQIYSLVDRAVVQIICRVGGSTYITGSGIIVSPGGIVLSNAHVLQYPNECIVKTGSPTRFLGTLDVVYSGNVSRLIEGTKVPLQDFAFGVIKGAKEQFSYLTLNPLYDPRIGDEFYLASYASELIGNALTDKQALVFTTAKMESYYVTESTRTEHEIIELEGNVSTQEGSSGSPVILPTDGSVVGLVFGQNRGESDMPEATGKRSEFAFLISYLDGILRQEKGMGILEFVRSLSGY